ncbi:hypothetical protein BDA99DRAFT_533554 [Phascolomyces articulosus]|uniref:Uncharacterized protein n=1 Tax=Phascolomyces articulosus TaxID=60185 RepID=A0AAD5PHP4_9FUNG|nr:hypothetical protein BDA99DRAFT_533554 [Phascolomyces articulosus]
MIDIGAVLIQCPTLETFFFRFITEALKDADSKGLPPCNNNIKSLDLLYTSEGITADEMQNILEICTGLRRLTLMNIDYAVIRHNYSLRNCTYAKTLNRYENPSHDSPLR